MKICVQKKRVLQKMNRVVRIAIANALYDNTDKVYGFHSMVDMDGFLNREKRYSSNRIRKFISKGQDLSSCLFYDINQVPYKIIACDNGIFRYNSTFYYEDTKIYYYGADLILRCCDDDKVYKFKSYREGATFLKRNDAYFSGQFKEKSTFITSSDGVTYHIDQFKNKHLKVDPFVNQDNYNYAKGQGIGGYMPGASKKKMLPSVKHERHEKRKRITELLITLDEQYNTLTEAEKHQAPEFFELQRLLGVKGSKWI